MGLRGLRIRTLQSERTSSKTLCEFAKSDREGGGHLLAHCHRKGILRCWLVRSGSAAALENLAPSIDWGGWTRLASARGTDPILAASPIHATLRGDARHKKYQRRGNTATVQAPGHPSACFHSALASVGSLQGGRRCSAPRKRPLLVAVGAILGNCQSGSNGKEEGPLTRCVAGPAPL